MWLRESLEEVSGQCCCFVCGILPFLSPVILFFYITGR